MLQVSELRLRFRGGEAAEIEDFGAQFGAGGAEEISLLSSPSALALVPTPIRLLV